MAGNPIVTATKAVPPRPSSPPMLKVPPPEALGSLQVPSRGPGWQFIPWSLQNWVEQSEQESTSKDPKVMPGQEQVQVMPSESSALEPRMAASSSRSCSGLKRGMRRTLENKSDKNSTPVLFRAKSSPFSGE